MPIIETNGLCKRYGHTLSVHDLALRVPEGSVYGFLGPNGAGQSTTLKMILGLVRPTAGGITVFGKPMNGANRLTILQQVGSLIESPSYYGHLTGEENLRIVQTLRGVPEKNIREVLQIVRLDGQRGKKVAHYSLGMKQRLGLAAALLGYPKLLILDEPTNGLDPAGIQEMRELICSLPERFGMTVVVSSHLLSEIDQMADHVGIIREGRLVFQDTLETLHSRSTHHLALRTTDNEQIKGMAAQVKNDLDALGFDVTIQTDTSPATYAAIDGGEAYDILLAPGDPSCFGADPDLLLNWWYGDNVWMQTRCPWKESAEWQKLHGLMDEALAAEGDEQQKKWNECFDIIADNAVLYPVVHVKTVSASWDDPSTAPNGEALDGFKGIGTTSMSFRGVATVKA